MLFTTLTFAIALFISSVQAGVPATCAPTPFTTVAVTTIPVTTFTTKLVPTTVLIPHSCFTNIVPVPQSDNAFCGTTTLSCGPHPDCIVLQTSTVPCPDACCPHTPTITTPGACATCQTGCATQIVTATPTNCHREL